jgi:PAS domain-containing protein
MSLNMAPESMDAQAAASVSGGGPAGVSDDEARDQSALIAVAFVLALAAMVSLVQIVSARRQARAASRLARRRGEAMKELISTIRQAESDADLGVWQYDPATGEQHWSRAARQPSPIAGGDALVADDAASLFYAKDIDLVAEMRARAQERAPLTLSVDIRGHGGAPRSIRLEACNLFGKGGQVVRIIAVVRDVSGPPSRERWP